MIGKTLGHYQISNLLGKGGMGEVYQAKDQKLGRDVAIKVLPEEFARDADRVARFQREAKLLASLNHLNIAAIHGLEESGGTGFLILELVEGETLAQRLQSGPIPVEESLKLALQIAEALEAAHDKGVIHRDLKPANIKVTPEGKVKVLDFGLAKAYTGEQEEVNLSHSPTLSDAATQRGLILGTAAYMSPEQARGKTVDKRTDIWAFGCVLFEMLSGRAAFSGKDVADILAAVIRAEPEWSNLPRNLHWRLREALERCLEKEAKNRYSGISDTRVDIQKVLADPSGIFAQSVTPSKSKKRIRVGFSWLAATLLLGAAIAGLAVWRLKPSEPRQVIRSEYDLPESQQFNNTVYPNLAVSPDGRRFVYVTAKGLYLRSLDEFGAKLIGGTETSPANPFFSPDGKWIGYFSVADSKLKKISINGGAPVTICNAALLVGARWGEDDKIVFVDYGMHIARVSANGGIPDVIIKGGTFYHPQLLPDGKSLLITSGNAPPYKIIVQSLQSDERRELFAGDNAWYIPTGHIVYALGNNLFAVPFDLKTLRVKGGQVPMVEGIWRVTSERPPQYAVSDSGTLVYIQGTTSEAVADQSTLVWVDRKGKEVPIEVQPNSYTYPRVSPDETKVAVTVNAKGKSDIWTWDLARGTMTRLTFNETSSVPLWTPDGKRIAFVSGGIGKFAVYWKAADGTGDEERLGSEQNWIGGFPWSWSGDGKTLLLYENSAIGGNQYFIDALSMEGDRKLRTLLKDKYYQVAPKISPNGRWMAYMSNESGKPEIYVHPFPEVNTGKWQVSTNGGNRPLWSRDGRELFYRNGDSVMAVAVQTEPTFKLGKTQALFRGTYGAEEWDVSHDGKRFLMVKPLAPANAASIATGPRKINIVINWFEELKQRVPLK